MSSIISSLNNNTVTGATSTTATNTANVTTSGTQMLTQADFLKIMVAQFTQQDPLSSDDSGGSSGTSDYVNELMSMTNLTTMQTMSGQEAQQLAESLPGDTVEVDNNGTYSTGVVQNARLNASDDGVYFTVNGAEYPLSDLYSVSGNQTTAAQNTGTNATTNSTSSSGTTPASGTTSTN